MKVYLAVGSIVWPSYGTGAGDGAGEEGTMSDSVAFLDVLYSFFLERVVCYDTELFFGNLLMDEMV